MMAEIETLPGITPDYARKIIAGRPCQSMSDLRDGSPLTAPRVREENRAFTL